MEKTNFLYKNPFFEGINNVHFVGVVGISLSALARLSISFGLRVSGSDMTSSAETRALEWLGAKIYLGHSASSVADDVDMLVYSGAIPTDNPEIIRAKEMGIPIVERSQYLAEISKLYDHTIAIAGSHGKTTTTSMIGYIFSKAKLYPTVHVGGLSVDYGNLMIGKDKIFVTEACEYRNSFGYLVPETAVVTNIDNDHLDYYKTKQNLVAAFQYFGHNTIRNLFVYSGRKFRATNKSYSIISVGYHDSQDVIAKDIVATKTGYKFSVNYCGEDLKQFEIKLYGKHNVYNALFAIAVAYSYGIKRRVIKRALRKFRGVRRRYEVVAKNKKYVTISDYAHHPTEIRKSILGLKAHFGKILVVFQPHTYSRTRILLPDFADAFVHANAVIVYKTYPAREDYDAKGDAKTLYQAIHHNRKQYVDNIDDLPQVIAEMVDKYNIGAVVLMGAGDMPALMSAKSK